MPNNKEAVLVLGANGRFGRVVASAFADAGWTVIAQIRRAPVQFDIRLKYVEAALTEYNRIVREAAGVRVVVNALHPRHDGSQKEAFKLHKTAVDIAVALKATLMMPATIYNFGPSMPTVLSEDTIERPTSSEGDFSCFVEQDLQAVRTIRTILVRSGHFFGGSGAGSWLDCAILKDITSGRIRYPGPRNVEHAWAYLPDLAAAFVMLAAVQHRLEEHAIFHFPGHTLTGQQLADIITNAARHRGIVATKGNVTMSGMSWTLLKLAGLFSPKKKEAGRMRYLWRKAHRLSGARLAQAIGAVPTTDIHAAIETTLAELGVGANMRVTVA